MPGDDEDGTAHRDDGAFGTAAPGDAAVPFAEEGAGLRGVRGGVPEHSRQVPVAGGALALLLPADSSNPGPASPGHEVARGGKQVLSVAVSARMAAISSLIASARASILASRDE
jgi:hypothetical protein